MDKEKILRYYKTTDDSFTAARLLDLAEGVLRSNKYKVSFFLSPSEMQIAEVIANSDEHINVVFSGGYENAERNKAIFVHDSFTFETIDDISVLEVKWDKRYYKIAHKDILGSLTAICKREFIGDIILTDNGAHILCDRTIASLLISQLTHIASAEVSVTAIDIEQLQPQEVRTKNISATVSTLRLDAVASAGYGVSRTQMSESIKMQQVKLNHKTAKSPSQEVKEGDIIAYRSRGRVQLTSIKGTTKKGRISIDLTRTL